MFLFKLALLHASRSTRGLYTRNIKYNFEKYSKIGIFLSFNREKGDRPLSMNGKFELKNAESTQHFTICKVGYCSSISA